MFAELIPQAVAPHRPWVTSRLSIFTAAFNTTLIQPEDSPKTYDDLADPKWKGKLGVEADDANWFMSIAGVMGEDKAVALFRNIVAVNGMSMRKGHTLLSNLVVAGEVPLALTVYGYRINELKAKGAPIDGTVLPPAVALPTGIAVFAHAPHPYAATLFMDFFLGDGQRILAERGNVPTNRTVKEPPPGLAFVDVAKFLDEGDKWTKLFKEIFAGRRAVSITRARAEAPSQVRPNTRSQLRKHNFSINGVLNPRLRIACTRFCSPAASPSSAGIVAPSKSEPSPTPSSPACSSMCSMCWIIRSNGVSLS